MATHSSIPAWRIPWTEKSGGLQSMGSQRVRHDWSNLAHTYKQYSSYFSAWGESLKNRKTFGQPLPTSRGKRCYVNTCLIKYWSEVSLLLFWWPWQTVDIRVLKSAWRLSITSMHAKQCTPLNTINTGDPLPALWVPLGNLAFLDKRSKVEGMFSFSWCVFLYQTLWNKMSPRILAEGKRNIMYFKSYFIFVKDQTGG